MLDDLAHAISRHSTPLWTETAVPRLTLVKLDEVIAPTDMLYEPMVCFVASGAKRSVAGNQSWLVDRGSMFLSSLELPVTATFERVPYRSAVLHLDGGVLAELLLELDEPARRVPTMPSGVTTSLMTPDLVDAVGRWVRLLDAPGDIAVLGGRIETEILYRLLGSPIGMILRQLALADSRHAQVRMAAAWIRTHATEPLTVEEIAAVAHLSAATLHRHFKSATGMSPLQFQKRLRLQEARRLLVAGETSASVVAEAVGYASATQFNREYRRAYGTPPAQDAARLRSRLVVA